MYSAYDSAHVYVVILWHCYVLSMFNLSFIDPAMYCLCLCCHSLTPLCTAYVYVVIHWPRYVLSMFKLTFIDPDIYCPCLCCHSIDSVMYCLCLCCYSIDSVMYFPCLCCHSLTLLCTFHVEVVIHSVNEWQHKYGQYLQGQLNVNISMGST
jgi:hypothetical protein